MKHLKILIIIPIFLLTISCDLNDSLSDRYYYNWSSNYLQSTSSDRRVPDTIKSMYKLDAAVLAFRTMLEDSVVRENQVEINENTINEIYSGLICIYNIKNYRPIKLIIDKYKIHAFEDPSLTRLVVIVDTNQQWTQAWRNGNRLTGNQQVDNLILMYNLQLGNRWYFSNYHTLISPKPLNLLALRNLFKKINGVIEAGPDGLIGDGNDVFINYSRSNKVFTFKLGWNDCLAGCINNHYWEVAVTVDEKVKFVNEYGDPLP